MLKNTFGKISFCLLLSSCAELFGNACHALAKAKLLEKGSAIAGAPEVHLYELQNKMRVLILSDFRNPLANMRLILDAGALRDQKGKTGLAHFFEHMMFRKTLSSPEGHFDRTLAGVGGRGNASTAPGWVEYETAFPAPAFDSILELERQRFLELDVKEPFFTIEKGAVISERRLRYENDPGARGSEIQQTKIELNSSFEWPGIGTKADIDNMKLSDAAEFYKNHYTPENTIISVGGPFEAPDILKKIEQAFGAWKAPLKLQPIQIPKDYATRNLGKTFLCGAAVFDKTIQLNFPSQDESYESSLFMFVLQIMLDNHPDGRLSYRFQKSNLGQALAPYQVSWQKESAPYRVYFKLSKEHDFAKAEKFFWTELERVLKEGITTQVKQTLLSQIKTEEAEVASRMSSLLEMYQENLYKHGNVFAYKMRKKFIEKLTTESFHNWVKKRYLKANSYTFGIVPTSDAAACEESKK